MVRRSKFLARMLNWSRKWYRGKGIHMNMQATGQKLWPTIWSDARLRLKSQLSEKIYIECIIRLQFVGCHNGMVLFEAPDAQTHYLVRKHCMIKIMNALRASGGVFATMSVEYSSGTQKPPQKPSLTIVPPTVPTIEEVVMRETRCKTAIDIVVNRTRQSYGLDPIEFIEARRSLKVVLPRQIAMYLAKRITNASWAELARRFKKNSHSCVVHAVDKMEKERAVDPELDAELAHLERVITAEINILLSSPLARAASA